MSHQQATEQRLRHMATHDALTELPNRLLLSDRIRMTISTARRAGQPFAIATVGLDGFKKVNDALGHPIGDAVLKMAAARLRKTLRDSDTLARVGGDEFVAVLPGTATAEQVKLVTGRLLATLQSPFEVESHTIYLGSSIGVAIYPQHAEDEVRLLALADTAMSHAKQTGKARCVVYSARAEGPPEHDISLEAAMFHGVREGEFLLYYQPIVDATTRQIQGFETLMRWNHPTLGMVPPVRFIPIAEANGLINLLGAWALKAACVQLVQFEEAAGRPLYMSVNISPRQFRNDKFLTVLDEAIAFSGIAGERLLLEITEGTLMVDPVHAETILTKMKNRGARIAIDDFGTGYSSLAYLKRFPISVLKVDRAFIKDLPDSTKDVAICNACSTWPSTWICRWWPKASKPKNSWRGWPRAAASTSRVTTPAGRCPRTWPRPRSATGSTTASTLPFPPRRTCNAPSGAPTHDHDPVQRTHAPGPRHARPAVGTHPPPRRHARLHQGDQRHPRRHARRG